jgi:hypothetical protein
MQDSGNNFLVEWEQTFYKPTSSYHLFLLTHWKLKLLQNDVWQLYEPETFSFKCRFF